MKKFLAVCGFKNTGKTQLISHLLKELQKEQIKVGILKSSSSKELLTEKPDSDTFKYKQTSPFSKIALFQGEVDFNLWKSKELNEDIPVLTFYYSGESHWKKENWEKHWFNFFLSLFWDCELVICEGFKNFSLFPKIWLTQAENFEEIKKECEEIKKKVKNLVGFYVKAFLSDAEKVFLIEHNPAYNFFFEREKLLEFVKNSFLQQQEVLLFVNGQKIPMKEFVQDILKSTVTGFVKSLKNVPRDEKEIKSIEIKIYSSQKNQEIKS